MFNLKKLFLFSFIATQWLISTTRTEAHGYGAGILPYAQDQQGQIFFLLSRDHHDGWVDFGGAGQADKKTAAREGHEETMGVFTGHYREPVRNCATACRAIEARLKSDNKMQYGGYASYLIDVTSTVKHHGGKANIRKLLEDTRRILRRKRGIPGCYLEKRDFCWFSKQKLLRAIDRDIDISTRGLRRHRRDNKLFNKFRAILRNKRHKIANLNPSPPKRNIHVTADRNNIEIFNSDTKEKIKTLTGHSAPINDIIFNYDKTKLASCSNDDELILIWDSSNTDPRKWQWLKTIRGHTNTLAFSRDGTKLAYGSGDGTEYGPIVVLDISNPNPKQWREVKKLPVIRNYGRGYVSCLSLNHNGTKVAFAIPKDRQSREQIVDVWDIASEQWLKSLSFGPANIRSLAFNRDENKFDVIFSDGSCITTHNSHIKWQA